MMRFFLSNEVEKPVFMVNYELDPSLVSDKVIDKIILKKLVY